MTVRSETFLPDDSEGTGIAGVHDGFEQAWHRSPRLESHYVLAGQLARLRIGGATLARYVSAPFAHLRQTEPGAPSDLTIDLWDADETGIGGPTPATIFQAGETWALDDGTLAVSPDGRIVSHATRTSMIWLDRRRRHIAGWVTDARALPLYERARPLQIPLALCASDRGVHAVHGALVARAGRGVLLAGDSGTGKSTAALCCLEAGWTFLGDDWAAVRHTDDATVEGHGLYSSVSLEPAQAARFPHLHSHAVPPRDGTDLKALILLSDIFPARLGRTVAVSALALPRVVDAANTRIHPATKRDALLTMVRSALCTMRPRGGRAALAALTRLAQERPAFWLDLGRDLAQIPLRVDDILSAAS